MTANPQILAKILDNSTFQFQLKTCLTDLLTSNKYTELSVATGYWDSVFPHQDQRNLFGVEILRLVAEHPKFADRNEIRPVCLSRGETSQLLFFFVQLRDERLPKTNIERITREFVKGQVLDRYIIWFFGNSGTNVLKVVVSGKEGKKMRLNTLSLEARQWFKTYDYILIDQLVYQLYDLTPQKIAIIAGNEQELGQ
ncbi:hypothetical protein [Candidatus Magnetobacterium casense]|uniref:hypothetical protein n=1 Tax=Candidatus Magnetobacterium casense TaxID=1455061 RepID=UPI00058D2350|nr:hypothetical protein [Candidatus Magnetobacterium casensis]